MNRTEYTNRPSVTHTVNMFVGVEVEQSPAYGMKTLFVVGVQDVELIRNAATTYSCNHIYFGANQSFPMLASNSDEWRKWEEMIRPFLETRYWCTLDLDVSCVERLAESCLAERNQFIPMISVKLPYIQQLGYNATIKLDDKDFNSSNPGVWCHLVHDLTNRRAFTDWSKYTKDEVI
jgi:hypothetical protein